MADDLTKPVSYEVIDLARLAELYNAEESLYITEYEFSNGRVFEILDGEQYSED